MMFKVEYNSEIERYGALVYRAEDYSFDIVPSAVTGYTSILFDDVSLEVDEAGKVVSVWGLCPHPRWKEASLEPPKASTGELIVQTDTPLESGVSLGIAAVGQHLDTFVDRNSGWIMIRNIPSSSLRSSSAVEVLSGVIAEVNNQGQLIALWLYPENGVP